MTDIRHNTQEWRYQELAPILAKFARDFPENARGRSAIALLRDALPLSEGSPVHLSGYQNWRALLDAQPMDATCAWTLRAVHELARNQRYSVEKLSVLLAKVDAGLSDEQTLSGERAIQAAKSWRRHQNAIEATKAANSKLTPAERSEKAEMERTEARVLELRAAAERSVKQHAQQAASREALMRGWASKAAQTLDFELSLNDFLEIDNQLTALQGKPLSARQVSKALGLQAENAKRLVQETKLHTLQLKNERAAKKAARQAIRQAQLERHAYLRSLVHSTTLREQLGISSYEYQKWLNDGRLKPVAWQDFRKWGKKLRAGLFAPETLEKLTPAVVGQWRLADARKTAA